MLIVEGADCTGKTTLCRKLITTLVSMGVPEVKYQHLGRQAPDFDWYSGLTPYMHRWVVQDRFHIGEWVYPQVRGGPSLDRDTHRLIDARLRLYGAYTVVLSASDEVISERFVADDEMYPLYRVLRANVCYAHLPSYMDVDERVFLSKRQPIVTPQEVKKIAENYHHRQTQLTRITCPD